MLGRHWDWENVGGPAKTGRPLEPPLELCLIKLKKDILEVTILISLEADAGADGAVENTDRDSVLLPVGVLRYPVSPAQVEVKIHAKRLKISIGTLARCARVDSRTLEYLSPTFCGESKRCAINRTALCVLRAKNGRAATYQGSVGVARDITRFPLRVVGGLWAVISRTATPSSELQIGPILAFVPVIDSEPNRNQEAIRLFLDPL